MQQHVQHGQRIDREDSVRGFGRQQEPAPGLDAAGTANPDGQQDPAAPGQRRTNGARRLNDDPAGVEPSCERRAVGPAQGTQDRTVHHPAAFVDAGQTINRGSRKPGKAVQAGAADGPHGQAGPTARRQPPPVATTAPTAERARRAEKTSGRKSRVTCSSALDRNAGRGTRHTYRCRRGDLNPYALYGH